MEALRKCRMIAAAPAAKGRARVPPAARKRSPDDARALLESGKTVLLESRRCDKSLVIDRKFDQPYPPTKAFGSSGKVSPLMHPNVSHCCTSAFSLPVSDALVRSPAKLEVAKTGIRIGLFLGGKLNFNRLKWLVAPNGLGGVPIVMALSHWVVKPVMNSHIGHERMALEGAPL